jgi:probable rRNA maturation factor
MSDQTDARLEISVTDAGGRPLRAVALARWLRDVAPARARGSLAIALADDATMRRLNRRFAGKNRVTDVLSFPSEPVPALEKAAKRPGSGRRGLRHLGDIVIATGVARRQAVEAGHSYAAELRVLALHGLLHLLGFDHERDDGTMARVEARLRVNGGLATGVIERARRA